MDIFHTFVRFCFFFPSWYRKQCPGNIILRMNLFFFDTIVFFLSLKLIPLQRLNFFLNQLAFAGKIFSCLIQNNDFFHLSRGLLISATDGVRTFSGVCFRGTRGLSEILAKLNHNQRENVSNQNYTLGFNLLPWKSQGWHFYSIFRCSQMDCSLQDNFRRPSAFPRVTKQPRAQCSQWCRFYFFVGTASWNGRLSSYQFPMQSLTLLGIFLHFK